MKRKILFSSMLFGSLLVPLASVVSCGPKRSTGGRYDVDDDNQLIIEHTFSSTGPHKAILEGIIKKYNETQKGKPNFVPVKAVKIEGGYGTSIKNLEKKFQTRDKKTTPNMIVDYPDTAAILRQYRMELNAAEAINRDDWIPDFLEINDRIGGIKAGGIYAVPISLSSEMISIDAPLFAHVIDVWNAKFANNQIDVTTVPDENSKVKKIKEVYDKGKQSAGDLTKIKALWGEGIADVSKIKVETPTDEIFTHYDKMIAFVNTAQQMLGIAANNEKDLHMLGNDSPVNFIQELSFLYGDADLKNFIYTRDKDGIVNMDFLINQKSAGYKNLKMGYELIQPAIKSGALWLGGGGAYGSSFLTTHKMMFDIGSTSGYRHNFTSGKSVVDSKTKFDDTHSYDNINKGNNNQLAYDASKGVVIGSYKNPIHPEGTKLDNTKKPDKYEYVFVKGVSITDQTGVDNFFGGEKGVVAFSKNDEKDIDDYLKELINDKKEVPAKKIAHDAYDNPVYVLKSQYIKILTADDTLQKDELHVEIGPGMLSGKTKGMVFQQGPSLIPVHANGHEDKGTMAFLKWFTNPKEKYTFTSDFRGGQTIADVTPIFAWMKGAQYISPIKGAFDEGGELETFVKSDENDDYLQAALWAFKAFKHALDNENVEILNPPVDPFTNKLRNEVMGSLLRSQSSTAHAKGGDKVADFNQFFNDVKTLSLTKGIIE